MSGFAFPALIKAAFGRYPHNLLLIACFQVLIILRYPGYTSSPGSSPGVFNDIDLLMTCMKREELYEENLPVTLSSFGLFFQTRLNTI